jgi:hypothetical protein
MAANEEEVSDEDELEWYSRRLDAGLSSLQNADYILAWVCMEEDGVSWHLLLIRRAANNQGSSTCSEDVEKERSVFRKCRQSARRYIAPFS